MYCKRKNIYLVVSSNIKKYRKESKMTQQQLAYKSGYSHEYVRRIESKKCDKSFSIQVIYDISLALDIPVYLFFVG